MHKNKYLKIYMFTCCSPFRHEEHMIHLSIQYLGSTPAIVAQIHPKLEGIGEHFMSREGKVNLTNTTVKIKPWSSLNKSKSAFVKSLTYFT